MLRFEESCGGICCEREDGSDAAILYLAVCDKWMIENVASESTPDELRQIASKLEELNGK